MKTDEEMELRDILFIFLKRCWVVVIAVGVAGWYGHRKAQQLPNLFQSTALLVPASTSNSQRGGGLGGVGSATAASPDLSLYQALMTSRTVMQQILRRQVLLSADVTPILVAKFMGVDTGDPIGMQVAAANLAKGVALVDQGDGIISVSFTSTDPIVAPQMTDMVLEVTQKELNRIRSERLNTILSQLQSSVDHSYARYKDASRKLAEFQDANLGMESGALQARQAELQSDVDVRQQDYNATREKASAMRLELDQLYPPAVVFDPASRPALLVGPNRRNKVMLTGFVGLLVGIGIIVLWEFLLRKGPKKEQDG